MNPYQAASSTIGYLRAGGRLGNAMSTYAAMLAVRWAVTIDYDYCLKPTFDRESFGIRGLVDLTTFQLLDIVFRNVREVGPSANQKPAIH